MSIPETLVRERRARRWDRRITVLIVLILLLPFPFVQFQSWPDGRPLYVYMAMPWSGFRICYTSVPEGRAVEEVYRFSWTGKILPASGSPSLLLTVAAEGPLTLKWRGSPAVVLRELYQQGALLEVKRLWQPLLLWPLRMVWQTMKQS